METTKQKLYNFIITNVLNSNQPHPPLQEIDSCVTYARELGLFTALYIPFEVRTDEQVLSYINNPLRPPYFRNTNNLITKQALTPEDYLAQNQQHIQYLKTIDSNTNQTFVIDKGVLVETKPLTPEDLVGKRGIIAKNHLTRTVTYSAHAVAIPDHTLTTPHGPTIGIPRSIFKRLRLSAQEPIMFLRNPVIKADGVQFAYPIPTEHKAAISVHPYFCSGMNLDFDGDQIIIYRIIHPDNIKQAINLINTRYPNPLPLPESKDFKLIPHDFHGLSLQDYAQNTPHMQKFLELKPSKKATIDLVESAQDLLRTRTEKQFQQHLTKSKAYEGLFRSKADIGKTGGLYKKLVYAFPEHIPTIMEIVEPLSQATLDQKHTTLSSNFSIERVVNAFSVLEEPSNLEYLCQHIPEQYHEFLTYVHNQLKIKNLSMRHKENMPLLTYLGTKFSQTHPAYFNRPKNSSNLFHYITSLNNPTNLQCEHGLPELPELDYEQAQELWKKYHESMLNKDEMIPQKYLNLKDQLIYEHRFFKTVVDKTNSFSEYLTGQMVSIPHDDKNLYLLPPQGFCPYQRTEKDPESTEPITFIPTFGNHTTSATPLNIPYRHNTEHARLVYACNNIKQAMQLKAPEEPLCKTEYHRTLKIGVNLKATFVASPYTFEDAVIISETASVKLTTIEGNPAKPGDKLTGRHGNKVVISLVLPDEEMPELSEIAFSPMSVTSRKNFGFLAEIQSNIMHNNEPHTEVPIETLLAQPDPKVNNTLTGLVYILRNSHTAESGMKVHGRPHGFTQFWQPNAGETISLNHIYALDTLNFRSLIAEFFSFRSNEEQITAKTMELNQEPESLQVIRALYTRLMSE